MTENYRIIQSKDGNFTWEYLHENRWYSFESKYKPRQDATSIVAQLGPKDLYVIGGALSWNLINEILNSYGGARIFIWDFDGVAMKKTQENYNEYVGKRLFLQLVRENTLVSLKEMFNFALFPRVSFWVNPLIKTLYPDRLHVLEEDYARFLERVMSDYQTQGFFGRQWLYNYFKNCSTISKKHSSSFRVADAWLIVGAGYSVQEPNAIVEIAREYSNNTFIVIADTMLPFFASRNLPFHAVCSIDASYHSLAHLKDYHGQIPLLFYDPCAHPQYVRRASLAIPIPSRHPMDGYFRSMQGSSQSGISTGGNVGHTMVSLAMHFGVTTIKTLGLDFSYMSKAPYARPVFLHTSFHVQSNRLKPGSQLFESLWLDVGERVPDTNFIQTKRLAQYKELFFELLNSSNGYCHEEKSLGSFFIFKPNAKESKKQKIHGNPFFVSPMDIQNFKQVLLTSPRTWNEYLETLYSQEQMSHLVTFLPLMASFQREYMLNGQEIADKQDEILNMVIELVIRFCSFGEGEFNA